MTQSAGYGIIYKRDVGKRLRALRHDYGTSQSAVADMLNIPRSTLGDMERGLSFPDLRAASLLARYYAVPVDFIAFGEGLDRELSTRFDRLLGRK